MYRENLGIQVQWSHELDCGNFGHGGKTQTRQLETGSQSGILSDPAKLACIVYQGYHRGFDRMPYALVTFAETWLWAGPPARRNFFVADGDGGALEDS